jgi:hypothetical protein
VNLSHEGARRPQNEKEPAVKRRTPDDPDFHASRPPAECPGECSGNARTSTSKDSLSCSRARSSKHGPLR